MQELLRTVFPSTATVNARGHLVVGGCDVVDLSMEFGTPLYVFDEQTLRERCREFLREFQARYRECQVVYACKAFANVALLRLLAEEGLGFDVVSGGELAAVRAAGVDSRLVYLHGNNKSRQELEEAVGWGVGRVVMDNFQELSMLEEVAAEARRVQEVLLRVSPGVDPHTHVHTTTGVLDSKFGFPIATGQAGEAVRLALASRHLRLVGLHFHLGSPIFETGPYREALRITLAFASRMREEGLALGEMNVGGGFAIAYTRDQKPPAVAEYAEAISEELVGQCRSLGLEPPRLTSEPGRAIVGPAGVAVYTVGARKAIPGVRTYVSVDGGMGDNIRPALYDATYEAVVANRAGQPPSERVTIAGKFCESGDILVREAHLPATQPGDLIALPAAGAYCPSMASNYNLAPRPAMVLVGGGSARLIRRRETYQDLLAADVP
ncbi:MAG: diaminopimelate decarboxylase [Chloroflexi bacterium]|nr:diaminopimelate decarboxylase [Chloroflexota bacterium]